MQPTNSAQISFETVFDCKSQIDNNLQSKIVSNSIVRGGYKLSCVVRKPAFCICENKDADQLRDNREADQRLCFRYTDSTIPLFPKYKISSL